ncbi:gliding motility-associated C-terminal domain-containing protein [Adhaeribacter terreus]|uniref:Gliding motility-associated C-terminal domain-containing protein n=1 Tax=Adhaeribacter terreus TaxID=529703 RepID=A0ABW0ECU1_9BACT
MKPTQTTTYTVTGSSVCSQSTASVTVVVLPKPVVTISGSASVCPQVQGVWYKVQNPQRQQVNWGVKGGTISTSSNDSISVNWGSASNTAQVWALPKNSLGCPGDTVFFPVSINVILATEKPKGADTLCLNEAKNISYRINKTTGSVYTWGIKGGTIVSGQNTNAIKVNWLQTGNGKLWVQEESHTSTSHCFGVSDTIRVIIHPAPDSVEKISGPMQVFTLAENQGYAVEDPQLGLVYNWRVSGGEIVSGQGNSSIKVNWENAGAGLVEVLAVNGQGCQSKKTALEVQISGAPQPVFYNIFTPNADHKNDAFVIENLQWYAENELVIYNRWGVEVFRKRNYKNGWKAENLSSGTYFYRFQSGKQAWKGWLEVAY